MKSIKILAALLMAAWGICGAQEAPDTALGRHDFFYAGQGKQRRMFIVKDGKVDWSYTDRLGKGEISDAVLMTDGDILVAHQYGVAEIDPQGNTVWSYAAPEGTEIHTIQPIGKDHVVFVLNGKPAKVVVMEIPACKIVREFEVPVNEKSSVHGQFRNARLTDRGTLLIANMSLGCIHEFNSDGQEVDRWEGFLPWSVQEMPKSGNILITGRKGLIQEINRQGKTVWQTDVSKLGATQPQKTVRLKDGSHIVNNWHNEWSNEPMDSLNPPVQAIEIDKDGNVAWELRAWKNPDLGPSTTIQPLADAVNRNRLFFGDFNGRTPKLFAGPNEPVGEGRGIHPARVAWIHSPGVAKWDGKTGLWVEDRWNDQALADDMMRDAVMTLTGESTPKKAWNALFCHFNKTHGRGERGYKKGEKIAIKLNMNNAITHRDTIELNSSPFTTLALVRSMVKDGGVREKDIIVCEPSRAITDSIYDKIHREMPGVRFIDNIGGNGREKCEYYDEQIQYSVDNGKMARGLAKCIVDADYLINSALLKTHSGPGVTLTGKNWYGATDINLQWRKNAHNNVSQDKRNGKPGYKTFVDFMAHKDLGEKTLLFLIDGTYGSRDVNGAPNPKWMKEPFNGDWACSLIVSQDEVACDAVAMDIIIGEWPEFGSLNFCDEYLREAATIPNTPSGTVYMQGGKPLNHPLGLFEHWNNPKERKYTKIDLQYRKAGKIAANNPDINYMGRIHWNEVGQGEFTYPGTSALLRFKGTGLGMETSPGSGKFMVEIDGKDPFAVNFSKTDSIMTLAENLTDTIHNVRITYAIEGYEFRPAFRAFDIKGKLLPADPKPKLKIEFIGNSITCGYGIEDDDPNHGFSYDTENHTMTYAYKTARALDADFNVVARSGIGIYRNYGSPREGDTKTMPMEYDYTMLYNHDHEWDHSKFHPDIICINLGTNDASLDNYDIAIFEKRYRDFLSHLRDLHPRAKIVLLSGCMLQGQALSDVKSMLDRLAAEDTNFYRFDMSPHTGELGYGADWHPSARQAERMAEELIPYLKQLSAK